jgi:hypothetical protein
MHVFNPTWEVAGHLKRAAQLSPIRACRVCGDRDRAVSILGRLGAHQS